MKQREGFTLIELLIVVAILGVLSGILFVSIGQGPLIKARDGKRKSDVSELVKAIERYRSETGNLPINRNPGTYYSSVNADFLQELKDAGMLPSAPHDPQEPANAYQYYDYTNNGASPQDYWLVIAVLESGETQWLGSVGAGQPGSWVWGCNTNYPAFWTFYGWCAGGH